MAKKEAERLTKQNAANPYAITEEESAQADNNRILFMDINGISNMFSWIKLCHYYIQ